MLGSLKRGLLLRPAVAGSAARAVIHPHAAAGASASLKLAGRLLPPRSFAAAAAAVGTEQSKQAHKKAKPFDKVRRLESGDRVV